VNIESIRVFRVLGKCAFLTFVSQPDEPRHIFLLTSLALNI
jgi:hypothetical protein